MTEPRYRVDDAREIISPALLVYPRIVQQNIDRAIEIAGGPERLCPHAKTHKTREVARMQLASGIRKHKCATIAEAEMLASAGAPDVLIAYPMVGPNQARVVRLIGRYPDVRFSVVADHATAVESLSAVAQAAGVEVDVLVDLDVGQHRTGVAPGAEALAVCELIGRQPALRFAGLHVYDGHTHQEDLAERTAAVEAEMRSVWELRSLLLGRGLPVRRMVLGGTPTFPVHARTRVEGVELSPGTFVFHDHGYGSQFPDLGFTPAALLLTRVISVPTRDRICLDLGYKAVASDPKGDRLKLLDVDGARLVLQNEEHLVVEVPDAARFGPGDELFAIPTHVCPTVALHRHLYVIEGRRLAGRWEVVARDRCLEI